MKSITLYVNQKQTNKVDTNNVDGVFVTGPAMRFSTVLRAGGCCSLAQWMNPCLECAWT